MKFKFIIKKSANFYFFVQSLLEWRLYNNARHDLFWKEKLERLSSKEKNALEEFEKIRSDYQPGATFFEDAFFISDSPFEVLRKNLSEKKYKTVKNSLKILEKKFNFVYKEHLPFLKQWLKILKQEFDKLDKTSCSTRIINILNKLYKAKPRVKKVHVYLLLSSPLTTAGRAGHIDNQSIQIEASYFPTEKSYDVLGGVWHEVVHLLFEERHLLPLIKKEAPRLLRGEMPINEIILRSLFPGGIMAQKFLQAPLPPLESLYFGKFNNKNMLFFSLTENYISQNKAFDKLYIKKLASLIKKP